MSDSTPDNIRLTERLKAALSECHSRLEAGEEMDLKELLDIITASAKESTSHESHNVPPEVDATLEFTQDQHATARQPLDHTLDPTIVSDVKRSVPTSFDKTSATIGLSLPDYEILDEIARGGMGVVFRARQVNLNRVVAVKTILAGQLASESEVNRFQAEAEAAANLHHRNIVAIHEVGRAGERGDLHYFSMDYIDGPSLTQLVRENPLAADRAAVYVEKIARAIDYAHRQGVLHRDLKPSNILIDRDDEPRITDFGLAKQIDADSQLTASGTILGSPSYMPPEQASGMLGEVGPASDVYSMGAILYELLTGRPPFRAETPTDTLLQVLTEEPLSPLRLQPKTPRDLDTICMKCLQKEPHRRYASSLELAEDLKRYLHHEPIRARPIGFVERAVKWTRRRPAWASLLAVSVLGLVTLIAVGIWYNSQLQDALFETNKQRALAEDRGDQLQTSLNETRTQRNLAQDRLLEIHRNYYTVQIQKAHELWKSPKTDISRTLQLLDSQRPNNGEKDIRGFEWYHLWYRCFSDEGALGALGGKLYLLRYLPNSDLVIGIRIGVDDIIEVYRGTRLLRRIELKSPGTSSPNAMDLTPAGTKLAVGWSNGTVGVYDFANLEEPLRTIAVDQDSITAVSLSPDGKHLATGGREKLLKLWELESSKLLSEFQEHTASISEIEFSPDGKMLASCGNDFLVKLYDVQNRSVLQTFKGHTNAVTALSFSSDGKRLASVGTDGVLFIRNTSNGEQIGRFSTSLWGGLWSVAFSPSGKKIAIGGISTNFFVFDLSTRTYYSVKGHRKSVEFLAFTPDGKGLASGGGEGLAKLWKADRADQRCAMLRRNGMPVLKSVCYTRDGKLLAVGGGDVEDPPGGQILLVDAQTHQVIRVMRSKHVVVHCDFSPDGKTLLTCADSEANEDAPGQVQLWNVQNGEKHGTVEIEGAQIALAVFVDDTTLALACDDGQIRIWDIQQSREQRVLAGHKQIVDQMILSANSKILITRSNDLDIRLWDVAAGRTLAISHGHLLTGNMAVSKDGRMAAWSMPHHLPDAPRNQQGLPLIEYPIDQQGLKEKFVAVYDLASQRIVQILGGNAATAECMAFSPHNDRLAIGGTDGILRIWDTATGHELLDIVAHSHGVTALAFSPDGTQLASIGIDGVLRIWLTAGR